MAKRTPDSGRNGGWIGADAETDGFEHSSRGHWTYSLAGYVVSAAIGAGIVLAIELPNRIERPHNHSLSHYKTTAAALLAYASDYDWRLPLAHRWSETPGVDPDKLRRFEDPHGPPSMAMMRRLSSADAYAIEEPAKQVLLFETTDRRLNAASNFVNVWWTEARPTFVAFADSSSKGVLKSGPNTPRPITGRAP